jgi:glycosyltransferase involved in cell wall biosynthesis
MNILLAFGHSTFPPKKYGGSQRVVWWLGKELRRLGHEVSMLVRAGSESDFSEIIPHNDNLPLNDQIPENIDVVHFHYRHMNPQIDKPYIQTIHGNGTEGQIFDKNSVFVSKSHAANHGADTFVYNGLDPESYGNAELANSREHIHFLAKASLNTKNVKGAKIIAKKSKEVLRIIGGWGFSFSRYIKYEGIIDGKPKKNILQNSKGLIFPVIWEEPFGLAIIESLYFGAPVFATPYGAIPELIHPEVGYLADNSDDLAYAVKSAGDYRRAICHEHVMENFISKKMAENYLSLYEKVIGGETLNENEPVNSGTSDFYNFT